jgi:transposase
MAWIDRVLQNEGIESHVVDPASIATSRRRRRAKTDKIDGETLVRSLLAYKRGEPRVCSMVKAPTPEEEDQRRLCRERKVLTAERVLHVNRGAVDREQGVSKAGNPRLRTTLIQLAWPWLRNQPQSALTIWFHERVLRNGGRLRKTTIVALARKLLVALWKYVTTGVVIEGAAMKAP